MSKLDAGRLRRLVRHVFDDEPLPNLLRVGIADAEFPTTIVLIVGPMITDSEMDAVTTLLAELYSHLEPNTATDKVLREGLDDLPAGEIEWLLG